MLADNVYLSQRDVRELQFAKASIATGWNILLREMGLAPDDISQVLLAGSFGAYLSPASAVRIGLVPPLALPRIVSAGNVASEGAKMAALSDPRARRGALDRPRGRVRRAVRARGLQRRCSSTSWRSRDEDRRAAERSPSTCRPSPAGAASTSRSSRCPALLHNRPERIAPAVKEALDDDVVAVAYADCGTYGALDEVLGDIPRLAGDHCYDVLARDEVRAALEEEPGTYLLTDFLARTFEHTVLRELGLDRHPELRDAYFGHYTRVLWLAQHPTPATRAAAERAAAHLGLPLEVREVGDEALERQLEELLDPDDAAHRGRAARARGPGGGGPRRRRSTSSSRRRRASGWRAATGPPRRSRPCARSTGAPPASAPTGTSTSSATSAATRCGCCAATPAGSATRCPRTSCGRRSWSGSPRWRRAAAAGPRSPSRSPSMLGARPRADRPRPRRARDRRPHRARPARPRAGRRGRGRRAAAARDRARRRAAADELQRRHLRDRRAGVGGPGRSARRRDRRRRPELHGAAGQPRGVRERGRGRPPAPRPDDGVGAPARAHRGHRAARAAAGPVRAALPAARGRRAGRRARRAARRPGGRDQRRRREPAVRGRRGAPQRRLPRRRAARWRSTACGSRWSPSAAWRAPGSRT